MRLNSQYQHPHSFTYLYPSIHPLWAPSRPGVLPSLTLSQENTLSICTSGSITYPSRRRPPRRSSPFSNSHKSRWEQMRSVLILHWTRPCGLMESRMCHSVSVFVSLADVMTTRMPRRSCIHTWHTFLSRHSKVRHILHILFYTQAVRVGSTGGMVDVLCWHGYLRRCVLGTQVQDIDTICSHRWLPAVFNRPRLEVWCFALPLRNQTPFLSVTRTQHLD